MKYLLIFLLKLGYTIVYLLSILWQILWAFKLSDVDFKSKTMNCDYEEYDGYYCKNIFDMWMKKYSQSEEVRRKWESERDSDVY